MTLYEIKLKEAELSDKIIYYDYIHYKRAAGWKSGLINSDWYRPYKIKRAKYTPFLYNLPDYYFLGFPIKEMLKYRNAAGICHACAVALSLYFDEFEIVTCNLENYVDHCNEKNHKLKDNKFEHTFLVINLNNKKCVIDTTWGMITDYDTYISIFAPNSIKTIPSKDLENNAIYKFLKENKSIEGPDEVSEAKENQEYIEYKNMIHKYMNMCETYKNPDNKHLQDFINRCLYKTSNSSCIWDLRLDLYYDHNKIEYPSHDLFSLIDDEHDFLLESQYKDTIERNKRVLESYHNIEEKVSLKQKILEKIKNIIQ